MRNRAFLLLAMMLMTGCMGQDAPEAEDDAGAAVEPAPVEVQADTSSVMVPDVDIGADTTTGDTTPR